LIFLYCAGTFFKAAPAQSRLADALRRGAERSIAGYGLGADAYSGLI
jgi:hypothetical protein